MRAIVLLSGGLDSTTCLGLAVSRFGPGEVEAVSFIYGQKHVKELVLGTASAEHYRVKRTLIELPREVFRGGASTLIDGGPANPTGTYASLPHGVSPTYVPFRNGNLLSVAAALAQKAQAASHPASEWGLPVEVWFGAHAEDAENWAYPDCTPEFIGAMAAAIYVGTYHTVRLVTPLEWLTKAEVVAIGLKLGVPYQYTLSCYNGTDPACGECPTCLSRLAAFKANHTLDPIQYSLVRR